ncbi:hypothetical protein M0802_014301 [Mischocyttarus mexicanus]|nr:hypothetical protein M0802_014301 [Mischocyttarus mexicanus]
MAGDFNARNTLWNDTTTNDRGRHLANWISTNAVKYKATLVSPGKPTYPKTGSILDHCIMDMRICTVDLAEGKLITLPYDSDHNAITLSISLDNSFIALNNSSPVAQKHFNYKNANWRKFINYLEKDSQAQTCIPHDRNLTIEEIDQYIIELEKIILDAITTTIPKHNPGTTKYYLKYENKTIRKLHACKSALITGIFKNTLLNRQGKNKAKKIIKKINKLLQAEFRKTVTAYWEDQVKNIDYRNPHKFFPNINRILRPKKSISINTLRVQEDNSQLSNYAQTKFQHLKMDNSYIFTDPDDKLLIIGKYLESINSPRYTNTSSEIKKIVDTAVNKLRNNKQKIRNKGLAFIAFNSENPAYEPRETVFGRNIFASYRDVNAILAKLRNKTSSGLDNIPTVVLKNLPLKYIVNYTIIFNNAINYSYYPSRPVKHIKAAQHKKIMEATLTVSDHNYRAVAIPHKKTVKYLGVTLDHLLRLNKHHCIQLNKARLAIKANSRIFYNSNLEAKAKIICYQLLIRPLLTYAAPVLWNTGSTVMEKYRRLERAVLRSCTRTHRTAESDYKKYVSNVKIYNLANISRIDCFTTKLCRRNYANYRTINNPIINKLGCPDEEDFANICSSGYIPPELFTLCDKHGLIQNENNLPVLYHIKRHCTDKTISLEPNTITRNSFSTALPNIDKRDTHRLSKAYWWLTQDAKYIDEIRRRSLWEKQHPNQRLVL